MKRIVYHEKVKKRFIVVYHDQPGKSYLFIALMATCFSTFFAIGFPCVRRFNRKTAGLATVIGQALYS